MLQKIIAGALTGLTLLALVACSSTTMGTTTVSLASAQAEAAAILSGLNAAATIYEASPQASPAVKQQITVALAAATTAVDAFNGVQPTGANPQAIAEGATAAISAVVAVLPIDPNVKPEIDLGLAVVDAFIGGIAPPAGVTAAPTTATGEFAPVPVPIPTPKVLPPGV